MGGDGFTMSNVNAIASSGSMAAAAAGGLGVFIPVISYMIVKGGASQFVHIAGQLSSATQSAAASSAAEVTSGNRSFDNISMGAQSYMMQSGFKRDMNTNLRQGNMEYEMKDGTIVKETAAGNTIMHSGPGITTSTGSKSFRQSDMVSGQIHEQLGYEKSLMDSESKEYSTATQTMQRQAVDYVARLAQGEASGQNYDYSRTAGVGTSFNKTISTAKDLQEKYNYSWQQAAETALGLSGGLKGGLSIGSGGESGGGKTISLGKLGSAGLGVGADIGGSASGSVSARNTDDQSFDETRSAAHRGDHITNTEDVVKAAKSMHFNENQSEEKSLADQLTHSYEKMQSLRDSISVHKQNVERYQHNIDHTRSSSFTSDADKYQDLQNFIAKQQDKYGRVHGQWKAHNIIENGGEEFQEYSDKYLSRKIAEETPFMRQMKPFAGQDAQYGRRSAELDSRYSGAEKDIEEFKQKQVSKFDRPIENEAKQKYEGIASTNEDYLQQQKKLGMDKFDKQQVVIDDLEEDKRMNIVGYKPGHKKENADS
jgi:hypothetical protein